MLIGVIPYVVSLVLIGCSGDEPKIEDTASPILPEDIDNDLDGFTENEGDCDDFNNTIYPGATDIPDNGLDEDCSGADELSTEADVDDDGDGFTEEEGDCNDINIEVYPGATETCLDNIDSDCDGTDSFGTCEGTIGNDDFTIFGDASSDRLGQALSYAGNITGDSAADIVLGSRWNGLENGVVYVFEGASMLSGSRSASGAEITITGSNAERFGYSVAGGTALLGGISGDFNGDGNDDLLVGAPNADVEGNAIGAAYLFYGPLTEGMTSGDASVVFTGQANQDTENPSNHNAVNTGYSVAFVGDINNDGVGDIAIGDPSKKNSGSSNGEAYLIFGRADTFDSNGDTITGEYSGNITLNETSWREQLGREILSDGFDREQMGGAIDAIGDVNGDGIDDLAVGAYRWDLDPDNQNQNNGAVFVWYGGQGITDGDNRSEIIVGGKLADANGEASGAVYIMLGGATGVSSIGTADAKFTGAGAGNETGMTVSGMDDIDGDGFNEILVGSPKTSAEQGAIHLVYGNTFR